MHGKNKTVERIVHKVEEHYRWLSCCDQKKEVDREMCHGTQGSDQGVTVVAETQIIECYKMHRCNKNVVFRLVCQLVMATMARWKQKYLEYTVLNLLRFLDACTHIHCLHLSMCAMNPPPNPQS